MNKKKTLALSLVGLVLLGGVAYFGFGNSELFQGALKLNPDYKTLSLKETSDKVIDESSYTNSDLSVKEDSLVKVTDSNTKEDSLVDTSNLTKTTDLVKDLNVDELKVDLVESDIVVDEYGDVVIVGGNENTNANYDALFTSPDFNLVSDGKVLIEVNPNLSQTVEESVNAISTGSEDSDFEEDRVRTLQYLTGFGTEDYMVYENLYPGLDRDNLLGRIMLVDYVVNDSVLTNNPPLHVLERTTDEDASHGAYDMWITEEYEASFPVSENDGLRMLFEADRTCSRDFSNPQSDDWNSLFAYDEGVPSYYNDGTWNDLYARMTELKYLEGYVYVENSLGQVVFVKPLLHACKGEGSKVNLFFREYNESAGLEEDRGYYFFNWSPNLCTEYEADMSKGEKADANRHACPDGEYTVKSNINGQLTSLGTYELR